MGLGHWYQPLLIKFGDVGVLQDPRYDTYCTITAWDNGSGLEPEVSLTYMLGQSLPVSHKMRKETVSEIYGN